MPIALERGGEIERSGFGIRGIVCSPIYGAAAKAAVEEEEASTSTSSSSSSSSSSIGKNSESFGSGDLGGEKGEEVDSPYKGPLGALEALEEALPMRRGISKFYNGKSKSFASLSDVMTSCPSVMDISKQDNAYTRKRRNLLASRNFCVKSTSSILRSNGGGISKKPPSNGRSMLALAMAMSNRNSNQEGHEQHSGLRPPLHPSVKILVAGSSLGRSPSPEYYPVPLRSFSTTDLQTMTGSTSSMGFKDVRQRL